MLTVERTMHSGLIAVQYAITSHLYGGPHSFDLERLTRRQRQLIAEPAYARGHQSIQG
jgi:hypothetical protein